MSSLKYKLLLCLVVLVVAALPVCAQSLVVKSFTDATGWTLDSGAGWAFGPPAAGGGQVLDGVLTGADPGTAATAGHSIFGTVLGGNYPNNLAAASFAKSPAVDCTGREGVTLKFDQFLEVEDGRFDKATIEVSNDGTTWTQVFANPATISPATPTPTFDSAWTAEEFDISAVADDQATVFVRFGLGPTDAVQNFGGWNLDNIQIVADITEYTLTDISTPDLLTWGETGDMTVTLDNSGESTWNDTFALFEICTAVTPTDKIDRWNVASIPVSGTVAAGDSFDFSATMTAPPLTTIKYKVPFTPTEPMDAINSTLPADFDLFDQFGEVARTGDFPVSDIAVTKFADDQPSEPGEWARFFIEELAGRVPFVVQGFAPTVYGPTIAIDRGTIAVFIARAAELTLTPATGTVFRDIPANFWAASEIEACAADGIVSGFADGTYQPLTLVTRDAMCKFIALGRNVFEPGSITIPGSVTVSPFPDDVLLTNPFITFIQACKNTNIVQGFSPTTFLPALTVDRATLAVFVWRAFVRDFPTVVVLGGPELTEQTIDAACPGWAEVDTITVGDSINAVVVLDAAMLDGVTGTTTVTFEFNTAAAPTAPAVVSFTASINATDANTAAAAAKASGVPYLPLSAVVSSPLLVADDYIMTTKINGVKVNRTDKVVTLTVEAPPAP